MPLGPMPTKSSARYRSRTDVSPLWTAIRTCSSSPATPFSVPPPVFFSCDQTALPNDNVNMRQQIQILFIETSNLFCWNTTVVPVFSRVKFRATICTGLGVSNQDEMLRNRYITHCG